jgi:hypothetical protein
MIISELPNLKWEGCTDNRQMGVCQNQMMGVVLTYKFDLVASLDYYFYNPMKIGTLHFQKPRHFEPIRKYCFHFSWEGAIVIGGG